MSNDFYKIIDYNLNRIKVGDDIYRLEYRGLDNKILDDEKSLMVYNYLTSQSLIDINSSGKAILSFKGMEILESGGWNKHIEENERAESEEKRKTEIIKDLEVENLKLQNESFEYQKSLREKDEEIKVLTSKNLKLQNRQLKRYVFYGVIGFIVGWLMDNLQYVSTNVKSWIISFI